MILKINKKCVRSNDSGILKDYETEYSVYGQNINHVVVAF